MKKILALMLALCLLLSAIPATAEDDLSGTWYLVIMGLTGGTFELNADGSCSIAAATGGEALQADGTWAADGSTITITVNDQPLTLNYDGTDLTLGAEAMAAFGGSSISAGLDISMLSALMKISREPGKITAEEFTAYTTDGTIPEGKTKEDMDAIQAEMLMLAFSMAGSMNTGSDSGTDGPADAPAAADDPELTIVEDNFYVREKYDHSLEGIYLAKVQNNTDVPLYLSSGTIVLKDADGGEAGKSEWLNDYGSRCVDPGEVSFVSLRADVSDGASVADYEVTLSTPSQFWGKDVAVEVTGTELNLGNDYFKYALVTVTNSGEELLGGISVAAAIRDSEGKLIDIATKSLYNDQLPAGSSIIMWADIDSYAVDYCQANNLTISDMEAYAWVDVGN